MGSICSSDDILDEGVYFSQYTYDNLKSETFTELKVKYPTEKVNKKNYAIDYRRLLHQKCIDKKAPENYLNDSLSCSWCKINFENTHEERKEGQDPFIKHFDDGYCFTRSSDDPIFCQKCHVTFVSEKNFITHINMCKAKYLAEIDKLKKELNPPRNSSRTDINALEKMMDDKLQKYQKELENQRLRREAILEEKYNNINQYIENNKAEVSKDLCCVCKINTYNCVFFPCKHLVVCNICSITLDKCPYCRSVIKEKIEVFKS